MELTKKQESDICLACGECCKRYAITILPREVKKISNKLNISQKEFLEKHCELFVKIYPKSNPGLLTYHTAFFPKRVGDLLSNNLNYLPPGFFVLPQIALKRKNGVCQHLKKDNKCLIYKERPLPCKLFPFMVVPGYEENYSFCELFRKTKEDESKLSAEYKKKLMDYFKKVDLEGIMIFKNPPKQGKLFLGELLIGGITLKQLQKMMQYKIKG